MRIIEIPKIEKRDVKFENQSSEKFIADVLGTHKRLHFKTQDKIVLPEPTRKKWFEETMTKAALSDVDKDLKRNAYNKEISKPTNGTSRFVMALHDAFDQHVPFTLSPEVVMMIISQEIAYYVKKKSDNKKIASLFTKNSDQKEKLIVQVNHFVYEQENPWLEGIIQFRDKLIEKIPSNVLEYMLPKFSNTCLENEVSHLVSFMDAASSYYDYGMVTMCGIPSFKIEGTADDWDKIIKSVLKLNDNFRELSMYFCNLIPILKEIRNTVDGNKVDNDFWNSIYKVNGGSGGPYSNGWFNDFYAHFYDKKNTHLKTKFENSGNEYSFGGAKLNNFPSNISCVPFIWEYYGKEIPMSFVAGVTGVIVDEEGFLTPKLGVNVIENFSEDKK